MASVVRLFQTKNGGVSPSNSLDLKTPFLNREPLESLYDLRQELGSGAFSLVREARHKLTNTDYAIKIILKKPGVAQLKKQIEEVENEINIMEVIQGGGISPQKTSPFSTHLPPQQRHPNIIWLKEVFETTTAFNIVMEFVAGGDLYDLIALKRHIPEKETRFVSQQIAAGLRFLHSKRIVHRDIKPENILLTVRGDGLASVTKICDLGTCKVLTDRLPALYTCIGSLGYTAPEVLAVRNWQIGMAGYGPPVDLWSFGVVVYFMLAGITPFYSESEDLTNTLSERGHYSFPERDGWNHVSDLAKDFIARLLIVEPASRMTIQQALNHPWLKETQPSPSTPSSPSSSTTSSSSSNWSSSSSSPNKNSPSNSAPSEGNKPLAWKKPSATLASNAAFSGSLPNVVGTLSASPPGGSSSSSSPTKQGAAPSSPRWVASSPSSSASSSPIGMRNKHTLASSSSSVPTAPTSAPLERRNRNGSVLVTSETEEEKRRAVVVLGASGDSSTFDLFVWQERIGNLSGDLMLQVPKGTTNSVLSFVTGNSPNLEQRWLIVHEGNLVIYLHNPIKSTSTISVLENIDDIIPLDSIQLVEPMGPFSFSLKTNNVYQDTHVFQTSSEEESQMWICGIYKAINHYHQIRDPNFSNSNGLLSTELEMEKKVFLEQSREGSLLHLPLKGGWKWKKRWFVLRCGFLLMYKHRPGSAISIPGSSSSSSSSTAIHSPSGIFSSSSPPEKTEKGLTSSTGGIGVGLGSLSLGGGASGSGGGNKEKPILKLPLYDCEVEDYFPNKFFGAAIQVRNIREQIVLWKCAEQNEDEMAFWSNAILFHKVFIETAINSFRKQ